MVDINDRIKIHVEAKGIKELRKAMNTLNITFKKFGLEMKQNGTIMDLNTKKTLTQGQAMKRLSRTLGTLQMQRVNMSMNKFNRELDKTKVKSNNTRDSLGRFKMELLGIMFFGMAMAGMFMGILQPALDAFGVFDIFSMMLLMLFLPTGEKVSDGLLDLMDSLDKLSPSMKELIGNTALAGVGLGAFLLAVSQLGLGVDSLIKTYKALIGWNAAIVAWNYITGLSFTAVLGWFIVIIAVAAILYVVWTENWGNIQKHTANIIDGIINIFKGLVNVAFGVVKSIGGFFIGLLTGDFSLFKEGIEQLATGVHEIFSLGFGKILVSSFNFLYDLNMGLWNGTIELLDGIITRITGKQSDIKAAFWGMLPDWLQDILKGVSGWATGITDAIKSSVGIDVDGGIDSASAIARLDKTKPTVYAPTYEIKGDFRGENDTKKLAKDLNITNYEIFKQWGGN